MNEHTSAKDCRELEKIINYHFENIGYLKNALTHSSYCNEKRASDSVLSSNERLEFLGDSVLSIVVSDYIYKNYSSFDEGDLTKIRAAVVCENTLAELARNIDLGDFIMLGHGEIVTNGRNRKSILSDAFEALIAAIYLDGGIENGMENARNFILPRIITAINKTMKKGNEDYKSRLQQITQEMPEELLEYVLIEEKGPPHDRIFTIEARLNSNVLGTGVGKSKREAEQMAAKEALKLFPDDEKS